MIYFVLYPDKNAVKIGYTKGPAYERRKSLQTGNSPELELMLCIEGDIAKEKQFHRHYSDYRINGGWFRYEGKLKEELQIMLDMEAILGCRHA